MNKPRKRAYRLLLAGYRYHEPKVSRLTIGHRRGSLKDLRSDFRELCRRVRIITGCGRIEYFAAWVKDFDEDKGGWRRHAHVLWTSPITRWTIIEPMLREIVQDNVTCWIDEMEGMSNFKIAYVLQYNARQKGESVRFSMSKGWLPEGYHEEWKAAWKRHTGDDAMKGVIADLEKWIELRRGIPVDRSVQVELVRPPTLSPPLREGSGGVKVLR